MDLNNLTQLEWIECRFICNSQTTITYYVLSYFNYLFIIIVY